MLECSLTDFSSAGSVWMECSILEMLTFSQLPKAMPKGKSDWIWPYSYAGHSSDLPFATPKEDAWETTRENAKITERFSRGLLTKKEVYAQIIPNHQKFCPIVNLFSLYAGARGFHDQFRGQGHGYFVTGHMASRSNEPGTLEQNRRWSCNGPSEGDMEIYWPLPACTVG